MSALGAALLAGGLTLAAGAAGGWLRVPTGLRGPNTTKSKTGAGLVPPSRSGSPDGSVAPLIGDRPVIVGFDLASGDDLCIETLIDREEGEVARFVHALHHTARRGRSSAGKIGQNSTGPEREPGA